MLAPAEIQCQRIKENRREMAEAVSRRGFLPAFYLNWIRLRYPAASWKAFSTHSSSQRGVFAETP